MNAKPLKLAIIASHPIQHFVPVYQRLTRDYGFDVKVFYMAENGVKDSLDKDFGVQFSWDLPLLEGYDYEFVNPGKIIQRFSFEEIDSGDIHQRLDDYAADAIWLNGYWARVNWRVLWKEFRNHQKRRIIYSSDSNLLDHRGIATRLLKQLIVRLFLNRCDAFIAVSEQNQRYLRHYGVPVRRIQRACYPIDMQRLIRQRDQLVADDRKGLREQYGIAEDAFVVIFSGKLVDYKRPADLVEALVNVANPDVVILFMGDGAQRDNIINLAREHDIQSQVVIAGFVNQSDIARHLYAADVLALTSSKEPFGAVVSEALPFGLPIIVSNQVGAVGENSSAQPERNALVYPWGDVKKLAHAIERLSTDKELYRRFQQYSLQIVMEHDTDIYCQALSRGLSLENN
ncbi:MAG: glycosyltransferase family 4 protein [Arenicella sp.]